MLCTSGLCPIALADGATNGQCFHAYVADTLVPALRAGDTVILDNDEGIGGSFTPQHLSR